MAGVLTTGEKILSVALEKVKGLSLSIRCGRKENLDRQLYLVQ